MKLEDIKSKIESFRETIGETNHALISEDLLGLISEFSSRDERISSLEAENESLKLENAELLKVNGKLFQKIGFEKEEEAEEKVEEVIEEVKIEDIIDEKGDLI